MEIKAKQVESSFKPIEVTFTIENNKEYIALLDMLGMDQLMPVFMTTQKDLDDLDTNALGKLMRQMYYAIYLAAKD